MIIYTLIYIYIYIYIYFLHRMSNKIIYFKTSCFMHKQSSVVKTIWYWDITKVSAIFYKNIRTFFNHFKKDLELQFFKKILGRAVSCFIIIKMLHQQKLVSVSTLVVYLRSFVEHVLVLVEEDYHFFHVAKFAGPEIWVISRCLSDDRPLYVIFDVVSF